jgi:hypothetical protein
MPNLEFLILFQRADAFIDQRLQRSGFRPGILSYFLIENVPKQPSFFLRQVRQFFEDFLNSHGRPSKELMDAKALRSRTAHYLHE